ncbi:hypothetical protein TL16_g00404 [Triparma laevis f. inornata]|uniref:Uncharacterized protein n=1 Tax=Triparma laevis f. inornata TaxID=1714386 RepID=A0A9W6ZB05_9STRA|nr:hypothetical protein TL16_g00404 [Triparma laevis f. inornata]
MVQRSVWSRTLMILFLLIPVDSDCTVSLKSQQIDIITTQSSYSTMSHEEEVSVTVNKVDLTLVSIDTGVKFWYENQTDSDSDYSWINTGYVHVEYCTDKVRGFGGG